MNKSTLITCAAAAALALPGAALAQGHGKGHSGSHATMHTTTTVSKGHAQTDSRAHVKATTRTGASIDRTRAGYVNARRTDDTSVRNAGNKWNGYACAPGLADRVPACVPPGQLQRPYRVHQRLPDNYRYYSERSAIPSTYFGRLPDEYETGDYRYVYSPDRSVYVVDPTTNLIRYVLNL